MIVVGYQKDVNYNVILPKVNWRQWSKVINHFVNLDRATMIWRDLGRDGSELDFQRYADPDCDLVKTTLREEFTAQMEGYASTFSIR